MTKFAMALASVAILALAAPAAANPSSAQERIEAGSTDLSSRDRGRHVRKFKVRKHDRGLHRGFSHSRHYGYRR